MGSAELVQRTDLPVLADTLARRGRVRVPQLLQASFAQALHASMLGWTSWARVTRLQGQHRSFDAAAMDQLDPARRLAFSQAVEHEARHGFQYLFDRYPLVDHGRSGRLQHPELLRAFALLRSQAFLDLGRALLAEPAISFADGQLTRYGPGHFLSLHDDQAPGMHRVAAYVINLSPDWPASDGGALEFLDSHGQLQEAWPPQFNSMSLFRVPVPHRVAAVAAGARACRFAITGWFRSGAESPVPVMD